MSTSKLTEAQVAALVTHCETSNDLLAKQVASAITGSPVGAQAFAGGGLLGRLGGAGIWDKVGPLLVQLFLDLLAKKATPQAPLPVPPA